MTSGITLLKYLLLVLFLLPLSVSAQTQQEFIQQKWIQIASQYGADRAVGFVIIQNESSYNPNAIGDKNSSFGLVQIHLPAHPDVSIQQAEDIDFSLKFLAENLVEGKCAIWSTCPLAKVD